jgi:MFS family permease
VGHDPIETQPETSKPSGSIFSYGLLVIAVTHTLTHVFARVHTTLFPILKDEFSLSLQQLGIIAAIPPLCQTILSIPTGLLSDKVGARKMIVVSLVVAAIGSLVASQTLTPAMLIVAVSLVYINTTLYHPAAYSFVTRLFEPRDRSRALGIHGAGGTFGVAIGPISLSILLGVFALGWRQAYLFWFFPVVLGIVAVLRTKSEPGDQPVSAVEGKTTVDATSLFSVSLVMFLLFIGVRTVARSMAESFMALYLVENRGLSESLSSLCIGGSSLMGIVAAPLGGFLAARYGEKKWLLAVLTVAFACFGLAFMVPNVILFVFLYLAYGFFNFLGMAANAAIMAQLCPSKRRGLGYALFFLPSSIMGAVAPMIGASIGEAFTLSSIFYVSTAIFFASLGVLKFGVKVRSPQ